MCCGQLRHLSFSSHVGLRQWTDSGNQSFCPAAIFRTYHFICSPVRCFIALSLTLSSSDYLCAVISYLLSEFIITDLILFVTRTSSCHTFKEAKANGGSPQLSSPSYSPVIVPFRRVGGNLVMKLTHKGDRERSSKSLGSGEHLATLGVTGRLKKHRKRRKSGPH